MVDIVNMLAIGSVNILVLFVNSNPMNNDANNPCTIDILPQPLIIGYLLSFQVIL